MCAKLSTDKALQLLALDELGDGQSPNRNNEPRLQYFDLIIHPGRAIADLIWRRNSVGATGRFSGKTSTNRRKINFRAHGGFVNPAEFFEPTEQRLAGGMCEWPFQSGLARPGRLANDYHLTQKRTTGN